MRTRLLVTSLFVLTPLPLTSFASATDSAACVTLVNNMGYGAVDATTGGEVSVLQGFLRSRGYLTDSSTGYLGSGTVAAIKAFQSAQGITSTGYLGSLSRQKIQILSCVARAGTAGVLGANATIRATTTLPVLPTTGPSIQPTPVPSTPSLPSTSMGMVNSCANGATWNGSICVASTTPLSLSDRTSAATATALGASLCTTIQPFYWEIGDKTSKLASGGSPSNETTYQSTTPVSIASASKWVYSSYVVQRKGGILTPQEIKLLNFTSGYVHFGICLPTDSVDSCLVNNNVAYYPLADGRFYYSGGHMQESASLMGLGSLHNRDLLTEIQSQIGDFGFHYAQPQLAGGIIASADQYAQFLRAMLSGKLQMLSMLDANAVCTNPKTPGCNALVSPFESKAPGSTENPHYGLGHWIEDDPVVGDGAYSSAGAFGFYPWIDHSKTYYGIVARRSDSGEGYDSLQCGRLIRKAWLTGVAQTGTSTPSTGGARAYVFTTNLALGSQGQAVSQLQQKLSSLGLYSGSVTGYFGLQTAAAVKAFQKAHNLDAVGSVGPLTRATLNQ